MQTTASIVHRYGFQGSEMDDEVKGEGNSYTTEFRQLDPRLGRWLSIDPLAGQFPWQSPYVSMDNNPICLNDVLGAEAEGWGRKENAGGGSTWEHKDEITRDNYQTLGYGEYMDEGQLPNVSYTSGTYSGPAYAHANGYLSKGITGNRQEVEFIGQRVSNVEAASSPASAAAVIAAGNGSDYTHYETSFDYNEVDNQMRRLKDDIRFRNTCKSIDLLGNSMLGTATVLITGGGILFETGGLYVAGNFLQQPFVAATGKYGVEAQVMAWMQIGNTAADATSQGLNIYQNGGSWNWGSTLGNLYGRGPVSAAVPGYVYSSIQNPNEPGKNFVNFLFNVGGNKLSNRIAGNTLLSSGMTNGLAGYTFPLIWNMGTNSSTFIPDKP